MTEPDGVVERIRLAAYAWVEDADRLLLVRIAPHEAGAGLWMLPGGGLDFGEDPADGVLRELAEETGLIGVVDELLAVRSRVAEPAETRSGHRIHTIAILYRVSIVGGELRDETDESTDLAAWVPLGAVDGLPSTPLLRWAREQVAVKSPGRPLIRIWWEVAEEEWAVALGIMRAKAGRLGGADRAADVLWDAGPPGRVTLAGETGEVVWAGPLLYLADAFAAVPQGAVARPLTIRGDPVWQSADLTIEPSGEARLKLTVTTAQGIQEIECSHHALVSAIRSFRSSLQAEFARRDPELGRLITFRDLGP